jgi:putative tricarboxylic transport membrane protein
MKKADLMAAVMGIGFSSITFIITLGFKKFKNVPVGPEFFPRWLSVGLFVCSVALLIQALKTKPAQDKASPTLSLRDRGMQRLLVGATLIVVYAVSWNFMGFLLATPLALFALMFLLGLRRYRGMALFSVSAVVVIFCAFRYLLGIDMPMGFLDGIL